MRRKAAAGDNLMPKRPKTTKAPKRPKAPATVDPDKLVRQSAGTYRTADDRFEVRDAGTGWFLVDSEQANDFGQELIQGPFATLAAVRTAIPPARSAKVTPIRPPAATKARGTGAAAPKKGAKRAAAPAAPPPPPPSWIDRLPKAEGAAVRRLIASLERDGIGDAEALVRRDREGIGPALATRLIERGLAEIVDELPERGRPGARELVRRAVELLTAGGTKTGADRPGWVLVEVGPEPEPPNRRITIRELDG
jgi:hypothetical protein